MEDITCKFSVGQLVHHNKFDYRGVVVDIDPAFQGTDEWYRQMARSMPPKDKPWYHVIVNDATHMTYVAERHLEADSVADPIENPLLSRFFSEFKDSKYTTFDC